MYCFFPKKRRDNRDIGEEEENVHSVLKIIGSNVRVSNKKGKDKGSGDNNKFLKFVAARKSVDNNGLENNGQKKDGHNKKYNNRDITSNSKISGLELPQEDQKNRWKKIEFDGHIMGIDPASDNLKHDLLVVKRKNNNGINRIEVEFFCDQKNLEEKGGAFFAILQKVFPQEICGRELANVTTKQNMPSLPKRVFIFSDRSPCIYEVLSIVAREINAFYLKTTDMAQRTLHFHFYEKQLKNSAGTVWTVKCEDGLVAYTSLGLVTPDHLKIKEDDWDYVIERPLLNGWVVPKYQYYENKKPQDERPHLEIERETQLLI
jgi:hypothetical protein